MSVNTELTKLDIHESLSSSIQDIKKNLEEENSVENNADNCMSKETKSKHDIAFYKPSCYAKNVKLPHSKRKFVLAPGLTDASAKVVLSERNVEIKDLESKVKFLKSRIKELENENKILLNVQSRQEKELKRFKEGIMDIPALLKSHKEEIKVYESTISNIRKELRDCQKELKVRNESLLKKENLIDKLNDNLKKNEKNVHEYSLEIKELEAAKSDLQKENEAFSMKIENLKNENDYLCSKVKDLNVLIENLEESLNTEKNLNRNLKSELNYLKEKCEKELMQVSFDRNIQSCGDQIHLSTVNDAAIKISDEVTENTMESSTEMLKNNDSNDRNACCIKSVDKSKGSLIHNFKSNQKFQNSMLKNSVTRLFETGSSNIKLLPPLRISSRELSTSLICDFVKTEHFTSTANKNFADRIKEKNPVIDYKISKFETKSGKSSNTTIDGKSKVFDLVNASSEDLQNHEFKNNNLCNKLFAMNGLEESQSSSFIFKDINETKIHDCLNRSLTIHDNLCEKFQNTQEKNIPVRYLENEKCSYLSETVETSSTGLKNLVNYKNLEYKSSTDKVDISSNKSTFLTQPINLKPKISCYVNESSGLKSSRTEFDLSWMDN